MDLILCKPTEPAFVKSLEFIVLQSSDPCADLDGKTED